MDWNDAALAAIAALGAGLCILVPALLFSDQRDNHWRMLLIALFVPMLSIGGAAILGVEGWTWENAALAYLGGLAITSLTIGWLYRKHAW